MTRSASVELLKEDARQLLMARLERARQRWPDEFAVAYVAIVTEALALFEAYDSGWPSVSEQHLDNLRVAIGWPKR